MDVSHINFDFISPKIVFGRGKISQISREVKNLLKNIDFELDKIFLVTGKNSLKKSGNLDKSKILWKMII